MISQAILEANHFIFGVCVLLAGLWMTMLMMVWGLLHLDAFFQFYVYCIL
jgi:hypothetical protein